MPVTEVMHYNLRTVVIVIPLVAAVLVSSFLGNTRQRRNDAIAAYKAGRDDAPSLLLSVFGPDECRERMRSLAGSTSNDFFDGKDRWVKIIRNTQQFGPGCGEGLLVFSLSNRSSEYKMLPAGGIIKDVTFTDDALNVRCYGYFDHGSRAYSVPKDSPIEINYSWPVGAPPSSVNIATALMNEYMKWYRVK
ncbi:MAG: hypothetical protein U0930_13385 [Pirellulales bacterium]